MEDIDDSEFVASEHDQLISAITKLDKTQFITEPTRSEPTNLNSEFNLIKGSRKLNLNNVVKVLEDTSHRAQISKKLKKSQDSKQVLPKPLEKPQAERIKRATGYEQAKEKLGRWDPVVARSRTVDFVSFPLKRGSNKMQPTKEFVSKLELKSPLEKELDEIDPPDVEIEEDEEEKMYPMTYEEMLNHRQKAAKLRAQQSYNAAKAKRQSKIKSKKYHRILKKERLKQQLKEFEELQEKDPEEALKKLEALEKARALERHTLRHKNTGKWAKSKLVRAKYDKETRQELAEQLAVSRGLTKKTNDIGSSDDDDDANENIPDINVSQDPMNSWMLERSDKSNVDAVFDFGYKKYVQGKLNKKADSDSESDNDDVKHTNGQHLSENLDMLVLKQSISSFVENNGTDDQHTEIQNKSVNKDTLNSKAISINGEEPTRSNSKPIKRKADVKCTKEAVKSKNAKKVVATSNWTVVPVNVLEAKVNVKQDVEQAFDAFKSTVAKKVTKKLNKLKKDIQNLENITKTSKDKSDDKREERDNLEYLKLKKQKLKPVIDEELLETGSKAPAEIQVNDKNVVNAANAIQNDSKENAHTIVDTSRYVTGKPKYLNSVIPEGENGQDLLDDDDDEQVVPKVNMDEAFEEDDIEESFRQEKEDEINKDKPEESVLSLPGWGSWVGKGVKPPKKRKNRFITRGAPVMPRRDENKGDVIIKEFRDPKLAVHKVTNVPFPFTSVKDYEASIRAPLGNTFVTEKAHQQLIKPSVITKAGAIIEAMDEDELLVKKNRNFRNEKVLKLLGQK